MLSTNQLRRLRGLITRPLTLFCVLSLGIGLANAEQQTEAQLKALQEQIKARQAELDSQLSSAKDLEQELKRSELRIARLVKDINDTRKRLTNTNKEQTQLKNKQSSLQNDIRKQQDALATQLRSAYMTGQHDFTKMLFNLKDAGKLERSLSYYGYFNRARQEQIDSFNTLAAELKQVEQQLDNVLQELSDLAKVQDAQRQLMEGEQRGRQRTLNAMEKRIASEAAQIEQLQISEQNLIQALQKAAELAARQPQNFEGLGKLKGKLLRPTSGTMRDLFAKRRQGQIRWKGVLFNGSTGDAVKAVHQGKVLFADWLKGFGLVTVLDHGDGYMSLYGYNQALLKEAGEMVEAGEDIALVGQSGGQSQPGLYFEIRHKGEAVDPSQWLQP
ncbi:peptidoglycan DD-metalloendopeptidase family protein [Aliiglaciecola sp. CAU 1673]|uniref:murein hydrolase activator EnvC family protein n=1 Tax=Aliiglaciecola sp. CAU 1673 TaxID=3032595 RepID=UPI0023DAB043|nr:peptidoglycan DD-metalloendopeptidase family protein [Aliiglaciecola sp. CAU 1673]MDF2178704.1 peptidoglycan DD-metalloendopeptidase family protein [Aliiglaciecola sp. CAU 1673]